MWTVGIALIICAATIDEKLGHTLWLRNQSRIKTDTTFQWQNEDSAWTLTDAKLKALSTVQFGTVASGTATTATATFSTAYSAAPVVLCASGTNFLAHIVSITTSNVTFGVAATNATIQWLAIASAP